MNRSIIFIFIVNLLTTLLFDDLNAQNVEKGKLKIKITDESVSKIKQLSFEEGANRLTSRNKELDVIFSKFDVKEIKRLFPPAGKYEQKHKKHGLHLWYTVELGEPDAALTMNCIKAFQETDFVSFSEPFVQYELNNIGNKTSWNTKDEQPNDFPDDPLFSDQWHYNNTGQTGGTPGADISLLDAWGIERGSDDVIVAVIDGGLDPNHEDMQDAMWINEVEQNGSPGVDDDNNGYIDDIYGYNFVDNSGNIVPHYHGVHVGGTIGAVNNNGAGVSGIAGGSGSGDGVRLMSCQMFTEFNSGGAANTFVYAADNGAVIAQNSWGYVSEGYYEQAVLDAIDYFIDNAGYDENGDPIGPMQGGIVIFAAGNDNADGEYYPGYYSPVVAVASTDHNDVRSYFSNYGDWVDIAAPGSDVLSSYPNDTYNTISGTSMACPHVSGVAALIVSQFPGIAPDSVRLRLESTTDNIDTENPGYIGKLGTGRLNAFEAVLEPDTIPPADITDLDTGNIYFNKADITWTASGASDTIGSAYRYDMRISENPITDANFDQADSIPQNYVPADYGETESFIIEGLSSQTTYYVALKVIDAYNNASGISNVISFTTPLPPEINVSPLEFYDTLYSGNHDTNQMVVENSGVSPLEITLEKEVIAQPSKSNIKPHSKAQYSFEGGKVNTINTEQGEVEVNYTYEPETISLMNLDNVNIGFYTYDNGYLSQFSGDLTTRGANVFFYSTIDQNALDSLDVLYMDDEIGDLSTPDLTIIKEWVKDGGSILLQSDQEEANVNELTVEAGITAVYESGDFELTDINAHPTTTDVDTIYSYSSLNKLEISGSAEYIAKSNIGTNIIAASTLGSGKLMVCSNEISGNNYYVLRDNRRFSQQVIDWFVEGNDWLTIDTKIATIPSNDSLIINFTINAENLGSGDYEANINVRSNDPDDSLKLSSEYLHVIGAPGIEVDADSLEFGKVFTGVTKYDTLNVVNSGVDTLFISDIQSDNSIFNVLYDGDTLAPNDAQEVIIDFTPAAATSYQGNISIYSNDPDDSIYYINIKGEGLLPPEITITPDSLYTTLFTGGEDQKQFNIDNSSGGSDLFVNIQTGIRTGLASVQNTVQSIVERSQINARAISKTTTNQLSGEEVTINYDNPEDLYILKKAKSASSDFHVLVLAADRSSQTNDVVDKLIATNSFSSVTWINATVVTPTLNELRAFDAILVYSMYDYHQKDVLGDNLADYYDRGGNVVTAIYEVSDCCGYKLAGRWGSEEYFIVDRGTTHSGQSSMGNILSPDHPVVSDVSAFDGGSYSFRPDNSTLTTGGEYIAQWQDGRPLIVSKEIKGRERIALGIYPPSSDVSSGYWDASTDGTKIIENALLFNSHQWLSVNTKNDTIPAGANRDVYAIFDADGLGDGEYDAHIQVKSNDPANPEILIPAHLSVKGAPSIEISKDSIAYGEQFIGYDAIDSIKFINTGTDTLKFVAFNTSSSAFRVNDTINTLLPGASQFLQILFNPTTQQNYKEHLEIITNDPYEDSLVIELSGAGVLPPEIEVSPDSLYTEVNAGDSAVQVLSINNNGSGSDLHWSMDVDQNVGFIENPDHNISNTMDIKAHQSVNYYNHYDPQGENVLIFRDRFPWGYAINEAILDSLGANITVAPSSDMSSIDLSLFDLILFESFQSSSYYSNYQASFNRFESYLSNGGKIQFHACTPSYTNLSLPGNLSTNFYMTDLNNVVDPSHEITQNAPSVINGTYASHNYFDEVPGYANILVEDDSNNPTLITYDYGGGKMLVTGMTLEYSAAHNLDAKPVLYDALEYMLTGQTSGRWIIPETESDTLTAGESQDIDILLNARNLNHGIYQGQLDIISNDPGYPVTNIPVTLKVNGTPSVTLDTTSIDYDTAYVGYPKSGVINITNNGTKTLIVDSVYTDDDMYTVRNYADEILPKESESLEIIFDPDNAGTFPGDLHILTNDTIDAHLTVSLFGISRVPPELNFEHDSTIVYMPPDVKDHVNLNIQNTGANDLVYDIVRPVVRANPESSSEAATTDRGGNVDEGSGYIWIDSDEDDGPDYNWIDITSSGTPLNLSDDDYELINLNFDFPFYGETKSNVYITSNGFLTFNSTNARRYYNTNLPNTNTPNDLIAAFWDDLFPSGNTVYYKSDQDRFIVSYENISGYLTFQVILYRNGDIKYQYKDIRGYDYTVGIENSDGTEGLEVSYNQDYLKDEFAIMIRNHPNLVYEIVPDHGVIPASNETSVRFGLDTEGMEPGDIVYEQIYFETNMPSDSFTVHPMKVEIIESPEFINTPNFTLTVDENDTLTYDFDVIGEDLNDHLNFTLDNVVENTSVNSSGVFRFVPGFDQSGLYYFDLMVGAGVNSDTTQFSVEVNDINRNPQVIEEINDMELVIDESTYQIGLQGKFSDPDGDNLYITATSGNPNTVSAYVSNDTLNIYPKAEDKTLITLTIEDETDGVVRTDFVVNSLIENNPPELIKPFDSLEMEVQREEYSTNLADHFKDDDNDNLEYKIINDNTDKLVAALSGTVLEIKPLEEGNYDITIKALDKRNAVEANMHISVLPTNDPPEQVEEFDEVEMVLNASSHSIDLNDYFRDPEGDALSGTVDVDPVEVITATLDDNMLSIDPENVGNATITLSITDGKNDPVAGTLNVRINAITSLEEGINGEITLYPNPAQSYVYLKGKEKIEFNNYVLIDATGKPVDVQLQKVDVNEYSLNIQNIPAGMYLLRLSNDNTNINLPFVVE